MKTAKNIILLTLLSLLCSNTMAGSLYSIKRSGWDSLLVRIDTNNLSVEDVGLTSESVAGMAWDPVSQILYSQSGGRKNKLYTVDTGTGEATLVTERWIYDLSGLAFDCANQVLYANTARGGFFSIDTTSGEYVGISHWPVDDRDFHGLAYNQNQDILVGLKDGEGGLYLLEWRTKGGESKLYDGPEEGLAVNGLAYDADKNLYWAVNSDGELYSFNPAKGFEHSLRANGLGSLYGLTYVHDKPCIKQPFQITYGLTDAWFNPATTGQGFLVTVFPEIKQLFLAWFTYDTESPSKDVTAILGEPGHRWLTAQGPYEGDTANLIIYVTEGGVFDASMPTASTDSAGDGTMTVIFKNCNSGSISYDIPSIARKGEIPIERIALDKVPLCEQLELFAQ